MCMEAEVKMEEASLLAKEQRLRKAVHNAIVTLSECVVETTLRKMLNSLDQSSWMELVEERYLGRMCGFPLCSNPVEVKNSQKYRIDLKNKKVFQRSAEIDKFCCQDCFLRSVAVRAQLEMEPLWIRGDEQAKVFDLNAGNIRQQQQGIFDFEFSEDQQLITSLEILKIGDTAESDDEDNDDETNMEEISTNAEERKRDHSNEDFYSLCRSYITMKPAVSSTAKSRVLPTFKRIIAESVTKREMETAKKETNHSESEKLARIREKYRQTKLKRSPEVIEAKPLTSQLSDKLPKDFCEDFEKKLLVNLPESEEVVAGARSVITQFYECELSINKMVEGDMFLSPIDNADQSKQRISVLAELLKPSWRLLEGNLCINGCGQQALEIISTFRLSATNVFLERKACDLAVAVIFRLSLMDFYPSGNSVSSKLMQYLEQIGFDPKCYFEILSNVMKKL